MADKQFSNDILNTVKKKTGKNVSMQDINKLASGVKPSTAQSDAQLRKLIKQVSNVANVPVSEATIKDIIKAVKASGISSNNMEQMMKMMMGNK